jgi:hypothetical protein
MSHSSGGLSLSLRQPPVSNPEPTRPGADVTGLRIEVGTRLREGPGREMQRAARALSVLVAIAVAACGSSPPLTRDAPAALEAPGSTPPPAHRSPFTEPPGAFNLEVHQANIGSTICVPGWTATIRPPTSYTQRLKRTMLLRTGVDPRDATKYELDHFVPLALGGHPYSEDNLWLQSWEGPWSARVKDRLERGLQVMVCAGQISLDAARTAVQHDWHQAYRKYISPDPGGMSPSLELQEEEVVEVQTGLAPAPSMRSVAQ